MAQFHDDPPVELWRASPGHRDLNPRSFNELTSGMNGPRSGWRVWMEKPMHDTAAVGRMIAMYDDSQTKHGRGRPQGVNFKSETPDDGDLEVEPMNVHVPVVQENIPLGTQMRFGRAVKTPPAQSRPLLSAASA